MNTQQLKELAQRATGGVWRAFINEKANVFSIHTPEDQRCGDIIDWMGFDGVDCSKKQKARNARFIAASNPDTVIALIERLEAAEAELARRDAALGPQPAASTPDGWKLVPLEPHWSMIDAAIKHHEGEAFLPVSLYKAMLAATPAPGGVDA
ncbi:ead/Ea22-like family protein [Erwinia sp. AnSW2-5]|uniref:ead/Ea22-like family protein n=1 Tax=Erwinia sp. AnSW2-5 TaxID=3367692 RepID=UPI003859B5DA